MVTRIALVGASNLVSFERQPWIPCVCSQPCRNIYHSPQVPDHIVYKTFGNGGAKFNHPDHTKNAVHLFQEAMAFRPKTIVIYHDIIMNSLTLPDWAPPNAIAMSPEEVLIELKMLQNMCDCEFIVTLVRRRVEDNVKLPCNTSRNKGDKPLQFLDNLDTQMNQLLKENFRYINIGLSNASFKPDDPAHQTPDSLKMGITKIVRFYGK